MIHLKRFWFGFCFMLMPVGFLGAIGIICYSISKLGYPDLVPYCFIGIPTILVCYLIGGMFENAKVF